MSEPVLEKCHWKKVTGTTTIVSGQGSLLGFFISAASSTPTVKVGDSTSDMIDAFTPTAGTFYPCPGEFFTNLTVTIGGTVTCTVFWNTTP